LRLDHNAIYGGWNIEEIVNEGGAVTHPFNLARRKTSEMYNTLCFAIRAKDARP
jgi:hypothetical protein